MSDKRELHEIAREVHRKWVDDLARLVRLDER